MSSEANEATRVPVRELQYNMFKTCVHFVEGFKTVQEQITYNVNKWS